MNEWGGFEVWGPPAIVLGLGVVIGCIVALRSRGEASQGDPRQAEREALRARKQSLLEEIRGLEAERGAPQRDRSEEASSMR